MKDEESILGGVSLTPRFSGALAVAGWGGAVSTASRGDMAAERETVENGWGMAPARSHPTKAGC